MVRDGSQIHFWEDSEIGGSLLMLQYPSFYNTTRPKNTTVAEVLASSPPNFSWHRNLVGSKLLAWNSLWMCLDGISLLQDQDLFFWVLSPNGVFSVKSMYVALLSNNFPNVNRAQCPMEVKNPAKS